MKLTKVNATLEQITDNFFPSSGIWYGVCYAKPTDLKKLYLPCNTQNMAWLAEMFQREGGTKEFVQSQYFQDKLREYQLKIVEWQIDYMVNGDGEGSKIPSGYDEFYPLSPDFDIVVRAAIVKTLLAINLPRDVIEQGLEANNAWRETAMKRAYNNTISGLFGKVQRPMPFFGLPVNKEAEEKEWAQYQKDLEQAEQELPYDQFRKTRIEEYNKAHGITEATCEEI